MGAGAPPCFLSTPESEVEAVTQGSEGTPVSQRSMLVVAGLWEVRHHPSWVEKMGR